MQIFHRRVQSENVAYQVYRSTYQQAKYPLNK